MGAPRLRKVKSKEELEERVDDYMTQGYEILEEGTLTTLLRKKSWGSAGGHVLCLIFVGWWTLGIANAIYAAIAHYAADKVFLRVEKKVQKKTMPGTSVGKLS
jgi:hypothetical protein